MRGHAGKGLARALFCFHRIQKALAFSLFFFIIETVKSSCKGALL